MIAKAGGTLPAMIVANLPYNVGAAGGEMAEGRPQFRRAMARADGADVPEGVALRICAAPDENTKAAAVPTPAVMKPRIAMTRRRAPRPPPKVDSAVIVLTPLPPDDAFGDLDALETVTASAFGQRRKMLRSALKALEGGPEALEAAGIDPTRRAETLTQTEFRQLASA